MFGISFSEFILIGIIAIIVFGPEQLPSIAKKSGQLFAYFRNTRNKMSEQVYSQLGINDFNKLKQELTQTVDEIKHSITTHNSYDYTERLSKHYNYQLLYQPELDFDYQPELFDE